MNTETKRHIDSARQVMVGVVPNPTSQIDQITNALIYKFMDDMDQAAIKAGGDSSFFVGDLEKYAWTRLMDPRLGNQERMNLYSEALLKFSESKQLPELFRGIFKSAFLPYRSPETLGMFLKEINYFDYSHPEELGNAYEYLLSIMSSQGDAGQFRTPRHIIDFIVEAVNPTKDDKVLDPACGTAGFLISAYKHILKQHDGVNDPDKKEKPLTPDQRKNLFNNFEGYDIDPGMVRIAEVNMYLHQFKNPKIFQYDSLSMEDRWNDKFDVIMANPPFMSPKGGIKPHTKFSIQSSRSEVLFVDYIINHLRPKGRAGIIVPEGIIFQSGSAYKQLRKNLIDGGLYAVVSLPPGVFQPYSGVKTSILLFDNEISKQKSELLFIKIKNDGYDLGAQRKEISKNDLPESLAVLTKWKQGDKVKTNIVAYVDKSKVSLSGDYNLSGDRYLVATDYGNTKWPIVELGEVAEILKGSSITKINTKEGNIPVIAGGQGAAYYHNTSNRSGEVITVSASGAYAGFVNFFNIPIYASDCSTIQSKDLSTIKTKYLYCVLKAKQTDIYKFQQGGGQPHVYPKDLRTIKVPLPPIEVQEHVIDEINGYQKIIDGARQIISNWKPEIHTSPDWEIRSLATICRQITDGTHRTPKYTESGVPFLRVTDITESNDSKKYLSEEEHKELIKRCKPEKGDVLYTKNGTIGIAKMVDWDFEFSIFVSLALLKPDTKIISGKYLEHFLNSDLAMSQAKAHSKSGTITNLHLIEIKQFQVPVPPLEVQKQIVEKIEAERVLVESAKKLIEIYEEKIKKKIGEVWGA